MKTEGEFREFDAKTPLNQVHEWIKKEFGTKGVWIVKDPETGKFYASDCSIDEIDKRNYQIIAGGVA